MKRVLKIALKILGVVLAVGFVFLLFQFYRFSTPKSNKQIRAEFSKENKEIYLSSENFLTNEFRVLQSQKNIDTSKTTLVFVHGSIGSGMDFKSYFQDDQLLKEFNMMSYDRVGYGVKDAGLVKESIQFEAELLTYLIKDLPNDKVVLVGYSYGGPIALALKETYKGIILLAPAVYSEVEPMPWALNFYKWKLTRWMLPKIWQAASKEKLSHKRDLKKFEEVWERNTSDIISIHGEKDWIVPYENSMFLKKKIDPVQFELLTLPDAGHGLLWSHFETIKNVLLEQLKD